MTRSTCPTCLALVDTQVLVADGKVYFQKNCPEHGKTRCLVSADASWYLDAYRYARPGYVPRSFRTQSEKGCPHDCGLCPEHLQHTCLPIVEITDRCDMACPVCLVDGGAGGGRRADISLEEFELVLDTLLAAEGSVAVLSLGGGEPTLHPRLLDLLDALQRRQPHIGRISLSSNGLRLAADPALCRELAARRVYVSLQLDGFSDDVYRVLRGRPMVAVKEQALANLAAAGARVTLAMTVARGINEDQLGPVVRRLVQTDGILSLMIQPAAYAGHAGRGGIPHDPMDIVTIPEVLNLLGPQTEGLLRRDDFVPLPCPHPNCFCIAYLLRLEDGSTVPFARFVDHARYLECISNRATLDVDDGLSDAMRDTIDRLYSTAGTIPDSDRILSALKTVLKELHPAGRRAHDPVAIAENSTKSIFVHAFMDRWTFDLERVRKCCDQYPQRDGRMIPCCVHNVLRRS